MKKIKTAPLAGQTRVNIRSGPGLDTPVLFDLPAGVTLNAEGLAENGFYKIVSYVSADVVIDQPDLAEVPYLSQITDDAAPVTPNDCGQTCVAMLNNYKRPGAPVTIDQVTSAYAANPTWYEQRGIWKIGKYTTFNQGAQFLRSKGIGAFKEYIQPGALPPPASMCLINYSKLTSKNVYDWTFYRSVGAYHFVVFLGSIGNVVYVHDPLWRGDDGAMRPWGLNEFQDSFTRSALVLE